MPIWTSVLLLLFLSSCISAPVPPSLPLSPIVPDVGIASGTLAALNHWLQEKGETQASAVWRVPGQKDRFLVIAEGPLLMAVQGSQEGFTLLNKGKPLLDVAYLDLNFFPDGSQVLMLADHGINNSLGLLAWSFEPSGVRDLGFLKVSLPWEDPHSYNSSALPTARVFHGKDGFVVEFTGDLLLYPAAKNEKTWRASDGPLVFREVSGKLRNPRVP